MDKWKRKDTNTLLIRSPVKSVRLLSESKISQEEIQTSTSTMDKILYPIRKRILSRVPLFLAKFSS